MAITTPTNLDYLIDSLRLQLGDIDPLAYRYLDEWLRTSLVVGMKALQKWWNYKYLVDVDSNVYRNPNDPTFLFPEPPIVENADERPIVLMASIITKGGSLENNAWSVGSWRDAEIYYSNTEGSRAKESSLQKDIDELKSLLTPPNKKLARPLKGHLPGYKNDNQWETGNNEV